MKNIRKEGFEMDCFTRDEEFRERDLPKISHSKQRQETVVKNKVLLEILEESF